jgi:hypothetical protein
MDEDLLLTGLLIAEEGVFINLELDLSSLR